MSEFSEFIFKDKARRILATQMRVLPESDKEDYLKRLDEDTRDGFNQQSMAFSIYRDLYQTPYTQPRHVQYVTREDIKNRHRFGIIFRGIRGYIEATPSEKDEFRKSVRARAGVVATFQYRWRLKENVLERE